MNIKRLNGVNIWFVFAGILTLHIVLLTKLKFTAWPEMLLWPYLILKGFSVYKDIAIAHTPLLILDLALFFKAFGLGIIQLKIYTWLMVAVTDLIVFLVAKKLYGRRVAVVSILVFTVISLYFDGNGLWFDLVLAPLALLNFYFVREKKYLFVGIVTSLMLLTKQTAFWFFIPLLAEITNMKFDRKNSIFEILKGAAIVGVLSILILVLTGLFKDFWFWTVNYGIFTLPRAEGQIQLPGIRSLAVSLYPFSVLLLLIFKKVRDVKYLILWMVAGAMGVYPRFEFFHFQPALPFLALATGLLLSRLKTDRAIILKAFVILYTTGFVYLFSSFFIRNYNEGTRFYENDVRKIAEYVKNNTDPKDKIFVMSWWDNIYPLTDTLPATRPWVPQLQWYQSLPGVMEKEVQDLKSNRPKIIILPSRSTFDLSPYVPDKLFNFVMSNYVVKEKIDNISILILK